MAKRKTRWTQAEWDAMTEKEKLLACAEANLDAYGDIMPPIRIQLEAQIRKCPKCDTTKPIMEGFGTKIQAGVVRVQSYCKSCRGAKPTGVATTHSKPARSTAAVDLSSVDITKLSPAALDEVIKASGSGDEE